MNALERVIAAAELRPVDRVAVMPMIMRFAARLVSAPYSAYLRDARLLAEAQLLCQEKFGYDYVTVCSDGYREAEACGAELSFPRDSTPKVERPAISGLADLRRLGVPDPWQTGRMRDRLDSIRIFKEAIGGRVLILGWVEGPLAAAAAMCGLEPVLVGLHVDPEFVEGVLHFALAVETAFAVAQVAAGADMIGVGDAAASLISPEHYRRFALPYEVELIEAIHQADAKVKLHICGNTNRILDLMPQSGADVINVDWMVDLSAARVACSNVCLKGNMDPVADLLGGTPEWIRRRSAQDIAVGGETGYILSPGCEIAPDTPGENLSALVEAAGAWKRA